MLALDSKVRTGTTLKLDTGSVVEIRVIGIMNSKLTRHIFCSVHAEDKTHLLKSMISVVAEHVLQSMGSVVKAEHLLQVQF